MLAPGRQVKPNVELRNEFAQPLGAENGGSSSPPMEMNDLSAPGMVGDEIDFSDKSFGINLNWLRSLCGLGMTSTVKTYFFAERHMQVERHCV